MVIWDGTGWTTGVAGLAVLGVASVFRGEQLQRGDIFVPPPLGRTAFRINGSSSIGWTDAHCIFRGSFRFRQCPSPVFAAGGMESRYSPLAATNIGSRKGRSAREETLVKKSLQAAFL